MQLRRQSQHRPNRRACQFLRLFALPPTLQSSEDSGFLVAHRFRCGIYREIAVIGLRGCARAESGMSRLVVLCQLVVLLYTVVVAIDLGPRKAAASAPPLILNGVRSFLRSGFWLSIFLQCLRFSGRKTKIWRSSHAIDPNIISPFDNTAPLLTISTSIIYKRPVNPTLDDQDGGNAGQASRGCCALLAQSLSGQPVGAGTVAAHETDHPSTNSAIVTVRHLTAPKFCVKSRGSYVTYVRVYSVYFY